MSRPIDFYPKAMHSTKDFLKAAALASGIFARRFPFITAIVLVCALLVPVIGSEVVLFGSRTPEQIRAEEQEQSSWLARESAASEARRRKEEAQREHDRAICALKDICKQYGQVRQDCAAAGNFQNCIGVKMGDEKIGEVEACTNDGHVAGVPNEPTATYCFFETH